MPPISPAGDQVHVERVEGLRVLAQRVGEGRALLDVDFTSRMISLKVLFSCCSPRISRHCTSGRPASIIVANCRVKITSSLVVMPGLRKGRYSLMSFGLLLDADRKMHLRAQLRHHGGFVGGLDLALLDGALPGPPFQM